MWVNLVSAPLFIKWIWIQCFTRYGTLSCRKWIPISACFWNQSSAGQNPSSLHCIRLLFHFCSMEMCVCLRMCVCICYFENFQFYVLNTVLCSRYVWKYELQFNLKFLIPFERRISNFLYILYIFLLSLFLNKLFEL